MSYTLTVKGQVTIPKAVRARLGVEPGQAVDYQLLDDGTVRLVAAARAAGDENPFRKWAGAGIAGMSTEDILNETRGEGWNRP